MSLVDHSKHFSDRWMRIIMSLVDLRPLDTHRQYHSSTIDRWMRVVRSWSSPLVQSFPKRRTKENTRENWRIHCFFFDPRSSILIFCDFRKRLDDLRCVAVAGASLVVSLQGKIVSNLFLPSNDRLISDSLWLFLLKNTHHLLDFLASEKCLLLSECYRWKIPIFRVFCSIADLVWTSFFLPSFLSFLPSFLAWFLACFFLAFSNSKFRHRGRLCHKFCSGFWHDFLQRSC